jgi:hypothetical protein
MSDEIDAILEKHAKEESQRREQEQRKIEDGNRRTEMLNAFDGLRHLTLQSFCQETGEDLHFDFRGRPALPLPNTVWQWQAAKIIEACRSLNGWEGELEKYPVETEAQRVALKIILAGKDGDVDLGHLERCNLPCVSKFSVEVHKELWHGIPNALADIDRNERAPSPSPADADAAPVSATNTRKATGGNQLTHADGAKPARQSDTTSDTPKKTKKKRAMTTAAVDCVRLYKAGKKEDTKTTMQDIVETYVASNGGSVSSILKILSDNPDQWH